MTRTGNRPTAALRAPATRLARTIPTAERPPPTPHRRPRTPSSTIPRSVSRGYAEGPAIEERLAALERAERPTEQPGAMRQAVYGSTAEQPDRHFIGWLGEVDPDELFSTGAAWGITIVRRAEQA